MPFALVKERVSGLRSHPWLTVLAGICPEISLELSPGFYHKVDLKKNSDEICSLFYCYALDKQHIHDFFFYIIVLKFLEIIMVPAGLPMRGTRASTWSLCLPRQKE